MYEKTITSCQNIVTFLMNIIHITDYIIFVISVYLLEYISILGYLSLGCYVNIWSSKSNIIKHYIYDFSIRFWSCSDVTMW
jgi:hypothetical protein